MWHKSTIKYDGQNGKSATENFLHQAVSYGDVEAQLAECLVGRVTDYDTPNIARVKYDEVIFNNSKLPFYEVYVRYLGNGEAKDSISKYLIPAESPKDAQVRMDDYLCTSLESYQIEDADKTKILGVWFPHNEIWQGDFRNRMDERKEEGKHSPDINQIEIDFEASQNMQEVANDLDATVTVRNSKVKKIAFHKRNGDPVDA